MPHLPRATRIPLPAALAAGAVLVCPASAGAHATGGDSLGVGPGSIHQHSYAQEKRQLSQTRVRAGRGRLARASGLPDSWCGVPRRHDLPDPPGQWRRPVTKVIYAYPADVTGRFRYFADLLQSNASQIARFVASQSGQRKTLRFDMGSECGPDYLDIQAVPLSRTRVEYLYESPSYPGIRYPYAGQAMLHDEIQGAISGQTPSTSNYNKPVRNFIVFIDGINLRLDRDPDGSWRTTANAWDWGAATTYADESRDPYNQRNVNPWGQIATMFGSAPEAWPDGRPVSNPSQGFMPAEQLHEVFHTLGAVQNGAPNSTGWLHCSDAQDLMCYRDSSDPRSDQRAVCPPLSEGLFTQWVDCNRDDYFDPAPAPGGYLATRWNTFDSPFLGSCRELLRACGGVDASTAADQVPFDVDLANAIWRARYGSVPRGPSIRIKIRGRQPVDAQGGVMARVRCRRACRVAVPGSRAQRGGGRAWRQRRDQRSVRAGTAVRVKVGLTNSALRSLRDDPGNRSRPRLRVKLRVRDSLGVQRNVVRRVVAL